MLTRPVCARWEGEDYFPEGGRRRLDTRTMAEVVDVLSELSIAQIIGLTVLASALVLRVASIFFHIQTKGALIKDD